MEIVRRSRRVMRRYGDARKPLMVTEFSWTSGPPGWEDRSFLVAGEEGQAARVAEAYRLFAARRRKLGIERVYWFTWLSNDRDYSDIFNWSGLNRVEPGTVERKPSYASFREVARSLRGCGDGPCAR